MAATRRRRERAESAKLGDFVEQLRETEVELGDPAQRWLALHNLDLEMTSELEPSRLHPAEQARLDGVRDRLVTALASARSAAGDDCIAALAEWRDIYLEWVEAKLNVQSALNEFRELDMNTGIPDLGVLSQLLAEERANEERLRSEFPERGRPARIGRDYVGPDSLAEARAEASAAREYLRAQAPPVAAAPDRRALYVIAALVVLAALLAIGSSLVVVFASDFASWPLILLAIVSWGGLLVLVAVGIVFQRAREARDLEARQSFDDANARHYAALGAVEWESRVGRQHLKLATKRRTALERLSEAITVLATCEASERGNRLFALRSWRPDLVALLEFVNLSRFEELNADLGMPEWDTRLGRDR
ncbi:MAG: hypothetical protein L6Q84_31515 [Polyangiaceae bacterium]|nr:hypothetical protein [Polyangiaceae bacterium]